MIVATWLAFLLARERSGAPFPAECAQDIPVVAMETVPVLEHWLRKIEEEASRVFRRKLEGKEQSPSPPPAQPEAQDEQGSEAGSLPPSPSQSFQEDRTKIQFMRWSQTRVYRVSSGLRDEAMQERLEQIRSSVSQVMLQAMRDSVSDTDVRALFSAED
ncbi:spermatogenesis-associated protein 19, mitochondrial [Eudromia elegans]